MSVLEVVDENTPDDTIEQIESYWMYKLLSRKFWMKLSHWASASVGISGTMSAGGGASTQWSCDATGRSTRGGMGHSGVKPRWVLAEARGSFASAAASGFRPTLTSEVTGS